MLYYSGADDGIRSCTNAFLVVTFVLLELQLQLQNVTAQAK
jgi:hypothetical protein